MSLFCICDIIFVMASWSSRRRLAYGSIVILAAILFIAIPLFFFFYTAPSCSDGKMNGKELGIDCGGSCTRLCQNSFLPPKIGWGGAKFEQVAPGLYNVAAYVVNQNISGAALDVPYKISLFDDRGVLIVETKGKVNLLAHRNSLVFQPAVQVGKRIPARATFELTSDPVWFRSYDNLEGLSILDKKYQEDENGSSLEVTLSNRTLVPYSDIVVGVVLNDGEGNVIGFSQTVVDYIDVKGSQQIAPYTWPISRNGKVVSIDVMPSGIPPRIQ